MRSELISKKITTILLLGCITFLFTTISGCGLTKAIIKKAGKVDGQKVYGRVVRDSNRRIGNVLKQKFSWPSSKSFHRRSTSKSFGSYSKNIRRVSNKINKLSRYVYSSQVNRNRTGRNVANRNYAAYLRAKRSSQTYRRPAQSNQRSQQQTSGNRAKRADIERAAAASRTRRYNRRLNMAREAKRCKARNDCRKRRLNKTDHKLYRKR